MKPKFVSSADTNKKRTMYPKSDSEIIMIGNNRDKIIRELFDSLLHKYQRGLEQSMKSSNFIFDYVSEMHYVYNKITLSHGASYIDSPK